MDCVICGKVIGPDKNGYSGGANAEPIAEGQCCWECDENVVLPRRIGDSMREQKHHFDTLQLPPIEKLDYIHSTLREIMKGNLVPAMIVDSFRMIESLRDTAQSTLTWRGENDD